MLNQLGASVGIAVSALIMETARPLGGVHGAYWWVMGAIRLILAATPLLPGPPRLDATRPHVPASRSG